MGVGTTSSINGEKSVVNDLQSSVYSSPFFLHAARPSPLASLSDHEVKVSPYEYQRHLAFCSRCPFLNIAIFNKLCPL